MPIPVDSVSAPLPQLDLRDQSVITVRLDDPSAVIVSMVLHVFQTLPAAEPKYPVPLLTLEADT